MFLRFVDFLYYSTAALFRQSRRKPIIRLKQQFLFRMPLIFMVRLYIKMTTFLYKMLWFKNNIFVYIMNNP